MIPGLTDTSRFILLGKVSIGYGVNETKSGAPNKANHFRVMKPDVNGVYYEDPDISKRIGEVTKLKIYLPDNDINNIWYTYRAMYQTGGYRLCYSDNGVAYYNNRKENVKKEGVCNPVACGYAQKNLCKTIGKLIFHLGEDLSLTRVYKYVTTNKNSIVYINTALMELANFSIKVTGNVNIAYIPLNLFMVPERRLTPKGIMTTAWAVSLELRIENTQISFEDNIKNMLSYQPARLAKSIAIEFDEVKENVDFINEFYEEKQLKEIDKTDINLDPKTNEEGESIKEFTNRVIKLDPPKTDVLNIKKEEDTFIEEIEKNLNTEGLEGKKEVSITPKEQIALDKLQEKYGDPLPNPEEVVKKRKRRTKKEIEESKTYTEAKKLVELEKKTGYSGGIIEYKDPSLESLEKFDKELKELKEIEKVEEELEEVEFPEEKIDLIDNIYSYVDNKKAMEEKVTTFKDRYEELMSTSVTAKVNGEEILKKYRDLKKDELDDKDYKALLSTLSGKLNILLGGK